MYDRLVALPVPGETLRWVDRAVGRGARVVSVQRMFGGSSTAIHAVDVRDRRGATHRLVLRRFIRPNWKYPGLARREAKVLGLLERERYLAPRLVAFDDGPHETDVRAVLMTRLPGRVELAPKDIGPWLRQMAEALPVIHALSLLSLRPYRPDYDTRAIEVSRWSRKPRAWAKVLDLARSRQPRATPRFIHRDYHPGNILWSRGKLSGVVDWIAAAKGPPQIDVAHCRVNLVRLHGIEVADRFLAEYASVTGTSVEDYDPYWDAIGLVDSSLSPQITAPTLAPSGLTIAKMRSRLDEFAGAIAEET